MLALNNAQLVPFETYVTDLLESENDECEDDDDDDDDDDGEDNNSEDVEMNEVNGRSYKMAADNAIHVKLQQTSPMSDYKETESIQQPLKGRMSPFHLAFGLYARTHRSRERNMDDCGKFGAWLG